MILFRTSKRAKNLSHKLTGIGEINFDKIDWTAYSWVTVNSGRSSGYRGGYTPFVGLNNERLMHPSQGFKQNTIGQYANLKFFGHTDSACQTNVNKETSDDIDDEQNEPVDEAQEQFPTMAGRGPVAAGRGRRDEGEPRFEPSSGEPRETGIPAAAVTNTECTNFHNQLDFFLESLKESTFSYQCDDVIPDPAKVEYPNDEDQVCW